MNNKNKNKKAEFKKMMEVLEGLNIFRNEFKLIFIWSVPFGE